MSSVLYKYILDPENDFLNFELGLWYFNENQFSPASSFFLKCADRTIHTNLRYEALLMMFVCYKNLSDRTFTCESILKQAIAICPERMEAYYFLCELYAAKSDWTNVYTYSTIALKLTNNFKNNLSKEIPFPGKYALLFQKAEAAWWFGKPNESRYIYQFLLNYHIDELSIQYRDLLQQNLSNLGSGPVSQAILKYTRSQHDSLKFPFQNSDIIDENYSQVYQDMFILSILDGKTNGTYLEIGSSDPFHGNNTALLETKFGWTGVGIEFNKEHVDKYMTSRKNPVLHENALNINYHKILTKYFPNQYIIDYLQLDIEPSKNTFEALLSIPLDKYQFKIITYEHDYYVDITRSYRDKSRRYLSAMGYELVVNDVSPNENSAFEDWWVLPSLIDKNRLNLLQNVNLTEIHQASKYFLK